MPGQEISHSLLFLNFNFLQILYCSINISCRKYMYFNWSKGPSWLWLYVSWIYNCLCNQYLSPLKLWVCQWLATGRWISPGTPVSSTNKIDRHNINDILLKMALKTKNPIPIDQNKSRQTFLTVGDYNFFYILL